ncbi:MAG: T9SS type A sorting domain-containing protein, partial [Flavipsychrobacter sp.]
ASSGSTVAGSSSGSSGSTASLLNNPSGVFVDATGNIYIADAGNNRIQKWASGASSGSTVAGSSSGTAGSTASLLNMPTSIWSDGLGYLYICDANNNRIQRWLSGASSGITIGGSPSGASGDTRSLLNAPRGITLDAGANVYVVDYNNQRVQKFVDTIRNTFIPADTGIYTAVVTIFNGNNASVSDTITRTVTPSFQIGSPNSVKYPKVMVAICPDSKSLSFFVNPPVNGGSSPSFQWKVNNTVVATTDLSTPFIDTDFHRGDSVSCIMTSSLGCASPASVNSVNVLHIDTLHAYTPSVTITDVDGGRFCNGALDTFNATASGFSNTPTYIWKVNKDTVGINSSKLYSGVVTGLSLFDKDTVSCTIISLDGCAIPRDTVSNSIVVSVTPLHGPVTGRIYSITGDTICAKAGTTAFTVRPLGFSLLPGYQWTKNGKNIAGALRDTLILLPDSISDGDRIACILISADVCPLSKTTLSNADTLHVLPHLRPSVTITDSPGAIHAPGTTVTFTAHPVNGGAHPVYIWYKNLLKIHGVDTGIYVTNDVAVGDVISCVVFSNAQCLDTFAARSNNLTIRNNTAVAQIGNNIKNISLYPNPNSGNFTLRAQLQVDNEEWIDLEIINILGQQVYTQQLPVQNSMLDSKIFIQDIKPGLYYLRLRSDNDVANIPFEIIR